MNKLMSRDLNMNRHIPTLALLITAFLTLSCSSESANISVATNANVNSNVNSEPVGTPAAGGAVDQTHTAEAVVADLYKQHDAKKSPFFQTKSRALVDKYFTKPLADLIWKDANDSSGEVGAIDADPLYSAQDIEIKNFAVGKADVKGETATVPVTFTNYGQKQTVTFALNQVNAAWKIDDIKYSSSDSLMRWLKETYSTNPDTAASTDFEGKYQIGETTCTVKPVKMAFEVRWAKGSGVEMFFSKEGNSFESSSDAGETNRFVFDDENYSSGTFYRADGKTFPVKRVK